MKILSLLFLVCTPILLAQQQNNPGNKPKYVFLFIGDGMSTPQRMIADEFAEKCNYGRLAINQLPYHATTRTCSANSLVTDSAASGTAIACGAKTNNGCLGVTPDGARLESVAELAKKHGKKVGILTSITINHATPGAFYAHRRSRSEYYAIGLDLIASGFDYFGGGGLGGIHQGKIQEKTPELWKGDIYELAEKEGYKVVNTRAGLQALKPGSGKVFARGNNGSLTYAIDATEEAMTLEEFTRKGIELLDNPNGFFMMVEGGMIDVFGHSNDAASNLQEVLAFDKAVRVAMDFAGKHPKETLIIVTGDHETGGMTMGIAGIGYALYMDRLVNQKCSIAAFAQILKKAQASQKDFAFGDALPLLEKYFGLLQEGKSPMVMSPKEKEDLQAAFLQGKLPDAVRRLMAAKAGIGWTSGAHTALPVLTTSTGCSAELFSGFLENTDIARILKTLL